MFPLVISIGRDWPSVVKKACEVSQPRLLHAVQTYRPLSSFFTRWIVRIWLWLLRITPVNNPYCVFSYNNCDNSWSESVFRRTKPRMSHLSPRPRCDCFWSTPPLGLAPLQRRSGEQWSRSRSLFDQLNCWVSSQPQDLQSEKHNINFQNN